MYFFHTHKKEGAGSLTALQVQAVGACLPGEALCPATLRPGLTELSPCGGKVTPSQPSAASGSRPATFLLHSAKASLALVSQTEVPCQNWGVASTSPKPKPPESSCQWRGRLEDSPNSRCSALPLPPGTGPHCPLSTGLAHFTGSRWGGVPSFLGSWLSPRGELWSVTERRLWEPGICGWGVGGPRVCW